MQDEKQKHLRKESRKEVPRRQLGALEREVGNTLKEKLEEIRARSRNDKPEVLGNK